MMARPWDELTPSVGSGRQPPLYTLKRITLTVCKTGAELAVPDGEPSVPRGVVKFRAEKRLMTQ